jgi:hypothetical protein
MANQADSCSIGTSCQLDSVIVTISIMLRVTAQHPNLPAAEAEMKHGTNGL